MITRAQLDARKGNTMTILTEMPAGFEAYGRSPDFTPETLPVRLQATHSTKAGTWALLHVVEGAILYQLEPPYQGERLARAGEAVVIEAQVPHHISFVEPGRIYIEFYRKSNQDVVTR
jgi:hemoglobin